MTTSASTPRLRLTLLWYLVLVVATALARPPSLPPVIAAALDALALLAVGAAVLGRIWCSVFIAGRKDAELVVTGPYSACRHPLYLLSVLGGIGLGLATHSATLTAATVLLLCLLFGRAAGAEDAFLAARHPQQFAQYAATTPRFWPRFDRYRVPAAVEVRPPVLWKAFVDAGAFLLLLALVMATRQLRGGGAWPGWLVLP
jgi:protein-S-isoprenylcysteine O-methyltransferase Ste14